MAPRILLLPGWQGSLFGTQFNFPCHLNRVPSLHKFLLPWIEFQLQVTKCRQALLMFFYNSGFAITIFVCYERIWHLFFIGQCFCFAGGFWNDWEMQHDDQTRSTNTSDTVRHIFQFLRWIKSMAILLFFFFFLRNRPQPKLNVCKHWQWCAWEIPLSTLLTPQLLHRLVISGTKFCDTEPF